MVRGSVRAWSAAVCAALLWAGLSSAEPFSAEALLAPTDLLDIDISPNGEQIAAIIRAPEAESYNLVTFPSDFSTPPNALSLGDVDPIWVIWATDERLLVAVVRQVDVIGRSYTYPSARVYAFAPDGSDPVMLFDNQRSVTRSSFNLTRIAFLPDDPAHVIMPGSRNGDYDLWRVNIFTGDAEIIGEGRERTIGWYTDRTGEPMIRLDSNRSGSVVTAYAPPEDGAGGWRRVATMREEDYQFEFQPLAVGEEDGTLYVAARPDGADRAGIYIYDALNNSYVRQVAADPRVDVENVITDGAGAFQGYVYIDDRLEYRFTDRSVQSHFDAVREFLGSDVNMRIYDKSRDGRRWIVEAHGPQEPGAFYLYDLTASHLEPLYGVNATTPRETYAAMQAVRYPTRDGLEITGYLSLPPGRTPQGLPLVVMPHGGPELRDSMGFDVMAQFIASRGYAVFQPNFRGSSGYGRSFADAGRREWGAAMQNDITDGVLYLASQGTIDPDRVCIFGASYGGYAALAGAAFTPDLYKCAISMSGIADIRDFLRHVRRSDWFDEDDYAYWESQLGKLGDDDELIDARSPENSASAIRVPVLLIHGEEDWLVPPEQSEGMARALDRAGVPNRLVMIEDVAHSGWPAEQTTQALDEVAAFLAQNLPAD